MIKPKKTINEIKRMVKDCLQSRIAVQVNLGRNKHMQFCGVLSGVYPALFSITPDEKDFNGKTTYSYSDILCGTVKFKKIS
ncbi:MAG: Veg family protein [Clostridia bacterium]|nr:Veg family protein [Clostridia bacterium]